MCRLTDLPTLAVRELSAHLGVRRLMCRLTDLPTPGHLAGVFHDHFGRLMCRLTDLPTREGGQGGNVKGMVGSCADSPICRHIGLAVAGSLLNSRLMCRLTDLPTR